MKCIRCGLVKSGLQKFFVCPDCTNFSPLVETIYREVEDIINTSEVIDPTTSPILRLLADSSFIVAQNPQTTIYHRICEILVARALQDTNEITEEDLNRSIRTTRSWSDAIKVFEDLKLIETRHDEFRWVIILTNKAKKFAQQYLRGEPLTRQTETRLAHIYGGYVLLHLLYLVTSIHEYEDLKSLPYAQRPRTLWNTIMFLWLTAFDGSEEFNEEEMRKFLARRGIASTTWGRIKRQLQTIDSRSVQSIIKNMMFDEGKVIFTFDDYIMVEMDRVRELTRDRMRA